ncbi:uncharacterized protein LOC131687746 [Topomyia yanbarensis]|uniref:uncharacterized protein LOC131687746 n=1 Tax=Topomyia yanbarensis TaxID=2498891 RepID=UPI00273C5723|nr:uncharacterized protein LOC131687746 [Topomyia yanbarensis]
MPPTTSSSAKKSPALRTLQTKLKSYQNMFRDICRFADSFGVETTASQVTVRLEKLEELWEKVNDVILDIETHEDFEAEDDAYAEQQSEFGNRYYQVKSVLLDKVKELEEPAVLNASIRGLDMTQQPTIEHVRLPQIKLQTFDGNIDEWLSFRDLYTSLIHWKADLPDVEKFHYLKGCLSGEAKALIDPLSITRANYQVAWETLTKRYNDSKLLKRRQIQALFKLLSLVKESANELQSLLEGFERVVQTLDQLVQPADYKDLLLLDILASRLDSGTRRAWEEHSSTKEQDTVKDLTEFLQRRIRVLGSLPTRSVEPKVVVPQPQRKPFVARSSHSVVQNTGGRCIACSESHPLYQCPAFQRLAVSARDKLLRNHSLCRNCFRKGHLAADCSSRYVCRNCKGKHHTLVCFRTDGEGGRESTTKVANSSGNSKEGESSTRIASTPSAVSSNMSGQRSSSVLLATAIVLVEDDQGGSYQARALLDSGSECNFMTERLCQLMSVQRRRSDVSVYGIGQSNTKVKHKVTTTVKSRVSAFSRKMEFLLLPSVTANLPIANVDMTGWEIPTGVELADPAFFKSKASVFGWVVAGMVEGSLETQRITCNMAVGLEEILTRFWACEEIDSTSTYSPEEARCEEQYTRTVRRGADGRYTVLLPRDEVALARMSESRDIAFRRLEALERRLSKDPELRKQYNQFMAEYLELGHMRKVSVAPDEEGTHCYLPHHPVDKQESTTTKVRVVFDASCKTSSGTSLNDALLVGPVIQDDLRSIILWSRTKQYMVVADVEKMFRQIQIDEGDMPLQRIMWRVDRAEEVSIFELTTVTYGTKPAPFLATRTLKQLAMDEQAQYPLAARAAIEDVYMDDVLTGADEAEAALELRIQLDEMMDKGRFRLRKWASNCPMVLQGIPEENLAEKWQAKEIQLDPDPEVRTLGLVWLPVDDVLMFRFKIQELDPVGKLSKRKVLSIIATLFDPLGLVGAVITTAKIFMQLLWCLKDGNGRTLDWDSPLPSRVDTEWRDFHSQLPLLNSLRIDRCVIKPKAVTIELHFFSDASERAYGACAYTRSVDSTGGVRIVLLSSKSKVAPSKCQSIPRLELCGALMAAQLSEKISKAIKMNVQQFFWTDSTCVLQWLKAVPTTWTTFVANRVAKIQGITEAHIWQHVPGTQNPADLISRGLTPEQIQHNELW